MEGRLWGGEGGLQVLSDKLTELTDFYLELPSVEAAQKVSDDVR